MTKSGYVTILGRPNAGKSTLMNALMGEKLSIITNKPQTTRKRVLGILSDDNHQVIFLDTPGILDPNYLLQEKMMEHVNISVSDADILVYIIDTDDDPSGKKLFGLPLVAKSLKKETKKIILLNKIDLSTKEKLAPLIGKLEQMELFEEIIPISASEGYNIESVKRFVFDNLPEGPKFFPEDQISDANERFFVSEIIREKIFETYRDEVPYSTEVIIEEFKERDHAKDYISASVLVERDSQKPIIIGKKGELIKKLGLLSRTAIEEFLGRGVFLEIRVKVRPKWRSDDRELKRLGYSLGDE
ncbi:MAG: GTPase Era [Melioribacteraceae bacterium]|nr:MAG: GTPase Era [Melioribacteraceae bacterium]